MSVPGPGGRPSAGERHQEPFNIVPVLVDRHLAEGRAARPAIVTPERTVTYQALAAGVARAAHLLVGLGLSREQRVAILLPDSPPFVEAFLGAMKAGLVPVPLSTAGTADELTYALEDSGAAALVSHARFFETTAAAGRPPGLHHRLSVGGERPGTIAFETAQAREPTRFDAAPTSGDDMAYWLYSSGTTGRPKAVVHLHRDMLSCIEPYAREVLAMTADDRTFAVPRLFFSYGLGSCLYLPLWCGASTVLVEARPDPAEVLRLLRQLQPTLFFSVPTSFAALLRELDRSGGDLGSLRLSVSAGEPLSAGLYARWIATTGVECLDGLGATEVGYIFVSNRPGAVRPGSSGRLLPGYRARVADATGGEVPAGTAGDLWVAGESVAKGYWNMPAETREAFWGEWYRTGDVYTVDADGYFFYQGRRDDLLRVGANWVSPLEVEACLASHPAVAECAVVGVRDADGLEKPRAFVVLAPGVEPSGIEPALQAHARARLAGFKVPRAIVVVDALPKTATGKIQRYRLRQG